MEDEIYLDRKERVRVAPKRFMDNESLIAAVFKFPCLWDKTFHDYSKKTATSKAWRDVAALFISESRQYYIT